MRPHFKGKKLKIGEGDSIEDIDTSDNSELSDEKKKNLELILAQKSLSSAKKCDKLLKKGKDTIKKEKLMIGDLEAETIFSNLELKVENSKGRRRSATKKRSLKRGKPNPLGEEMEIEEDFTLSEKKKTPTSVRRYNTRKKNLGSA